MTVLLPISNSERQDILSLEQLIRHRLGYSIDQLQLKVEDNGIILRGFATSWYIKQLAQEIVMEHSTLPIFLNDIHVNFI